MRNDCMLIMKEKRGEGWKRERGEREGAREQSPEGIGENQSYLKQVLHNGRFVMRSLGNGNAKLAVSRKEGEGGVDGVFLVPGKKK